MAQNCRYILKAHASQKGFDGECIAQHVRVTTLGLAAWFFERCKPEQFPVASLPVGNDGLGKSGAGPEEILVVRVAFLAGGNSAQRLGYIRGNWTINRVACLLLVNHHRPDIRRRIVGNTVAFERDRIADSQTRPSHQFRECTNAVTTDEERVVFVDLGSVAVQIRRVDHGTVFVRLEEARG